MKYNLLLKYFFVLPILIISNITFSQDSGNIINENNDDISLANKRFKYNIVDTNGNIISMEYDSIVLIDLLELESDTIKKLIYSEKLGNIKIIEEELIISKSKKIEPRYTYWGVKEIYGYRIQLLSSSNKNEVANARVNFLANYSDIKTYSSYKEPNFKLVIGDFETYSEAQNFVKQIKKQFPAALIIRAMVKVKYLQTTDEDPNEK